MAPMERAALSSNWKKLQASLPKKDPKETPALKRKRPDAITSTPKKAQKSNHDTSARAERKPARKITQMNGTTADTIHKSRSIHKSKSAPALKAQAVLENEDLSEDGNDPDSEPELTTKAASASAPFGDFQDRLNEGVSQTAMAGKYIALDCEMVGYGPNPRDDSQLARVSIVNYHGEQIYDAFVLPQVSVTDYRTAITGITAKSLKELGRPFKEVQRDVAAFLGGRILVGHALKNDLDVLMLTHPRSMVRDTSRHANYRARSMGKTPALRNLARELLGIEIHKGTHSSVEDARTAMMLYKHEKDIFEAEHAGKFGRRNGGGTGSTGLEAKRKKKKKGKR